MNLAIPPDVWCQAAIALMAGVSAMFLGVFAMHRAWSHHDARAERDFVLGTIVHLVGISWVVLALAVVAGSLAEGEAQEDAVQELVVFVNAAVRLAVLMLAGHVLWDAGKTFQRRRNREAR